MSSKHRLKQRTNSSPSEIAATKSRAEALAKVQAKAKPPRAGAHYAKERAESHGS